MLCTSQRFACLKQYAPKNKYGHKMLQKNYGYTVRRQLTADT